MRRLAVLLGALAIAGVSTSAMAAIAPEPGPGDPRVRIVHYEPDQVVELHAAIGYQMTLEFGPGERIENVSIGDGLGWQVTPNHKANLLFLKPLDVHSVTDMTVVTNLRRYVFDLSARRPPPHGDRSLIFRVRFEYPEPFIAVAEPKPVPPPQPPRDVNHAYRISGAAESAPLRVFDDGRSTYFTFPLTADYPAIFAVEADRKEAVVNSATRDGYVVVDRLAGGFVLRHGAQVTQVVNDGYVEPGAAAVAAKPGKRHRGRFK
jgi:type IV secretion system protein VirB9